MKTCRFMSPQLDRRGHHRIVLGALGFWVMVIRRGGLIHQVHLALVREGLVDA
jgi:hypothetical protein